jgi:hypothetical protein
MESITARVSLTDHRRSFHGLGNRPRGAADKVHDERFGFANQDVQPDNVHLVELSLNNDRLFKATSDLVA